MPGMDHTQTPNALRNCSVIELRQYEMQPGRRGELITLFEREFITSQEAVGLQVLGIFRDADAPDRFVWLRGFADMGARLAGLQAFYGGSVWQQHRSAANATMVDSDNVLLLQPLADEWPEGNTGQWHALVCPLREPWLAAAVSELRAELPTDAAWFTTHAEPNNFPRLPVRSGAWLLALSPRPVALPEGLQIHLAGAPTRLRLSPTDHSPLR